jgi:hypothetical protein
MKPLIVSIYMDNIDEKTIALQQKVVNKRNPSLIPHIGLKTKSSHAETIDFVLRGGVDQYAQWDNIMFLDIDAIPLNNQTFDLFFKEAYSGGLIGNAQRSNHIKNGQHMFAAPSAFALSRNTYKILGQPSAVPNSRGDVGEEITWALSNTDIPLTLLLPISYDRPVIRMSWELDQSPTWKLANGYPEYGVGTRFGINAGFGNVDKIFRADDLPLIYHNFQIFHGDHQAYFQSVCEQELAKED